MICFLRRARRCFTVKGAGAGALTVWCIGGAVLGVKASELVACWTLANEIPFISILRCAGERLWIQSIAVSLDETSLVRTDSVSRPNLVNRPLRVLCDQRLWIGRGALKRG